MKKEWMNEIDPRLFRGPTKEQLEGLRLRCQRVRRNATDRYVFECIDCGAVVKSLDELVNHAGWDKP